MNPRGNNYSTKNGVVHWANQPIPQADAGTFHALGGDWARDAQHVFACGRLKKIDAATFEFLNPVFVRDAGAAYDSEGPIKGADAKSFEVLDAGIFVSEEVFTNFSARGYGRDCNTVYYHDQGFGRATAVRGADPKSFVSLRNDYGCDAKGVWFKKTRLAKADPKTWAYLGRLWSLDRHRVYYAEREVGGIDLKNFTVVNAPTLGIYATDVERFFFAEHQISDQEFWARVTEDLGGFEEAFRVAYHKIRKTCTTCDSSGNCYCKRKGQPSESCARCNGTGKCHVCHGVGRTKD